MSSGLRGTGRLADDLYLMAHHEVSGRPFLQPRVLGIGLAGGLLAELMLAGGIGLRYDGAVLAGAVLAGADQPGLPEDGLARRTLGLLAAEQPLPARDWLLFLARSAAEDVADRLERSGYLRRIGGRWRPGRRVPVDADWAFAPLLRVRAALDPGRPWSPHGVTLAGLAVACGLGFRLAQYALPEPKDPGSVPATAEATRWLPGALRDLIAHTQATADSALLSHRK
jgi:hypothetical protein